MMWEEWYNFEQPQDEEESDDDSHVNFDFLFSLSKPKDYYKILEVDYDATDEVIRSKFQLYPSCFEMASLKQVNERVVQISLTNSIYWNAHTFALTESDKLYAFGAGDKGQLGVELVDNQTERANPEQVDVDLG